jgi:hypothetical protein
MQQGTVVSLDEQAKRGAARLLHSLVAARQPERPQARETVKAAFMHAQKFPAPDRAIRAVTRAIPGYTQHRRVNLVVCHARQDKGVMMLHADQRQAG